MNCITPLLFLLLYSSLCYGQSISPGAGSKKAASQVPSFDSSRSAYYFNGICKQVDNYRFNTVPAAMGSQLWAPSLIKIRGNIRYDFIYRSLVDTPFTQKDFSQHTVQTTMDFWIRDQYPVRMNLLSRRSNSPYFSDITDVNVQFNRSMFLHQIREQLRCKADSLTATGNGKVQELEELYRQKQQQWLQLQSWLNNPARLQEIVAEKERLAKKLPIDPDSLKIPDVAYLKKAGSELLQEQLAKQKNKLASKGDSLIKARVLKKEGTDSVAGGKLMARIEEKKKQLDSLVQEMKNYEGKVKLAKKAIQDSVTQIKKEIAKIQDASSLKEFIRKSKSSVSDLPKGWQALTAINTIGIGRNWIDYSELTVKNISLTGVNIEANPAPVYFAFATGRINARFRDFVIKDANSPRQSLFLLRAGIGRKEKNNLILTYYNGKRSRFSNTGTVPVFTSNLEKVAGFSLEGRIAIDKNNYVVMETARSSYYEVSNGSPDRQALMDKIWNMKDQRNQAWSVKVYSNWPSTATLFTGYYRKMGERFQSFNLQPVNVGQEAYQAKVQQGLWKKRVLLEAGIRKNDFSNPYSLPGLNSKTVFKSFLATLRVPRYPVVSVGYYPSSQLTVLDKDVIAENQYNTLTAMVSHSYRISDLSMSSNVLYLRFYNQGIDTGFIYYNASSWSVNHYIFCQRLQSQSGFTYTGQQELKVITIEQSLTWQIREWLSVNGGLKYNRVYRKETLWGGTAGLTLAVNKIGTLQLTYDRSFLPGMQRNLLPMDMGRVGFYRDF